MCTELGGELMRRRLLKEEEWKNEFAKPEGTVELPIDENRCTDIYPILDGVEVGVWNVSYYANWLGLYIYDAKKNLIENRTWQYLTTLTQDDGCFFKAKINNYNGSQVIRATWL